MLQTFDNGHKSQFSQAEYESAVKSFIEQVHTSYNNPKLKIVWATGIMGNALSDWAHNIIDSVNDPNIYQIRTLPEGYGGHNGHPTLFQQSAAAEKHLPPICVTLYLTDIGIIGL